MAPKNSALDQIDAEKNEQSHWSVQRLRRVAAALTVLILVAALAGIFGSGPLSTVEATSPDTLFQIQYARFARLDSPIELVIQAQPANNEIAIEIENQYLTHFKIEGISPEPVRTRAGQTQTEYVFESASREPAIIRMHMRATDFGSISGSLKLSTSQGVAVRHFIYP
jgi:hypothetical protein